MRILVLTCLLTACSPAGSVSIREPDLDVDPDSDSDIDPDTDTDNDTDPLPLPDCEPFGLSMNDGLLLDHGSRIEGLASNPSDEVAEPTTVSINSREECAMDLRRGVIIGDAWVGPGGYPDVVICAGQGSEVAGEQGILDSAIDLRLPSPPTDLPDSGGTKELEWSEQNTFTVDRVFDDLIVRTRSQILVDGQIHILVQGTLELNNGTVALTPGSELDLWVAGEARVVWNSSLNADGDPGALRIHLLDGARLELNQGSRVRARVKGPDSEVSVIGRGTQLIGTVQAERAEVLWGGAVRTPVDLICP